MTKMKTETHLTRVSPGDSRAAPTQQFERQRTKCCVGVAQVQQFVLGRYAKCCNCSRVSITTTGSA